MAITAAGAGARLEALIEQVRDDQEAVEITSVHGTAHLVPAEEHESLRETAYLLRSPCNAERLRMSVAEARQGDSSARR
jgi:antitoxin YefM